MNDSPDSLPEQTAQDAGLGIKHLYWLDWIRFVAAFMVVVCHSRGGNWVEWARLNPGDRTSLIRAFFAVTRAGMEWVIVFFVLSGFLVGGKVLERVLDKTFNARAFAVDRISRIWVPLIPALLLTTGIEMAVGHPVSFSAMLGNIFALQGVVCDSFGHNEPLWSLSYEVWFYMLAGMIALLLVQPTQRLWLLIGLTVCFAVFTRLSPVFLSCWLLGAFFYRSNSGNKAIGISLLGLFLALLGLLLSQLSTESKSVELESFARSVPLNDIACLIESLGLGIFIADVSRRKPSSSGMITLERLGTSLAAFSYTLYLTHYPILGMWDHFLPGRSLGFDGVSFVVFIGKISSCLLVAWLMYLPFERQTPVVRKWLKSRFNPTFSR